MKKLSLASQFTSIKAKPFPLRHLMSRSAYKHVHTKLVFLLLCRHWQQNRSTITKYGYLLIILHCYILLSYLYFKKDSKYADRLF